MGAAPTWAQIWSEAITRTGVRRWWRADTPGHAGMPPDGSLLERPRLLLGLAGEAHYELEAPAGVRRVRLRAGDALFVPAGRWVKSRPWGEHRLIGAVFGPHTTRFYLMVGRGRAARATLERARQEALDIALGEEGRAICRLLSGELPEVAGEKLGRDLCEALAILAQSLAADPMAVRPQSKARFTWHAACDYLERHVHRPITRQEVADYLRVHPNHVSRLFARFGSGSLQRHLLNLRLERARWLLADPRLNVGEVAHRCGFASANYFARAFRHATGRTPTEARLQLRSTAGPPRERTGAAPRRTTSKPRR
jgi:AraC-like DNA-binding protein